MVVEDFPDFIQWLLYNSGTEGNEQLGALYLFLFAVLFCSLGGLLFGYMAAAIRHGPFEAFYVVAKVISGSGPDFARMSPRRIGAIARLAAKEAIRRRVVLVAFAIFAIALLFGGWFINSGTDHPDRVYINFVLWGTQLLILMMVMLISAFSIPDDIKNKTIYTVATKPVRITEIIFGRILGFTLLGTALLFVMGVISLLFVWRGLSHDHNLLTDDSGTVVLVTPDAEATGHRASEFAVLETESTTDSDHRHYLEIIEDIRDKDEPPPSNPDSIISQEERGDKIVYRRVEVRHAGGHTHAVTVTNKDENDLQVSLSDARGFFRARVPVYASDLVFFDRQGNESTGISVGEQWAYRGYVSGGITLSRAELTYDNFVAERFDNPDRIPLELTLAVFRSHLGDIERRVMVGIQFENVVDDNDMTTPRIRSEVMEFETREFQIQVKGIPRSLPGNSFNVNGEIIDTGYFDLFDDFAADGKVRLIIRCPEMGQYLGVAKADVYFRASDQAHWWNFAKGYMGIWMQMLIVITLGVAFSTFLSSPVTMLASICMIIFGFFSDAIRSIAHADVSGGGPIESIIRLVTQKNTEQPLPDTLGTTIIEEIDIFFLNIVNSVTNIVPNFAKMDFSDFLTYGYFVDSSRMLVGFSLAFSFCLGLSVFGYFCLKTRELAG